MSHASKYHFHARSALFYVAGRTNFEEKLRDCLLAAKPDSLKAVIVAQCRSADDTSHIHASALNPDFHYSVNLLTSLNDYIILDYNDQDDGPSSSLPYDEDEEDELGALAEAANMAKRQSAPRFKYQVYLRFNTDPQFTSRRWAYLLFNQRGRSPLITACSVPTAVKDEEVIVRLMCSSQCATYGRPVLGRKAILLLLDKRNPGHRSHQSPYVADKGDGERSMDEEDVDRMMEPIYSYYSEGHNPNAVKKLFEDWKTGNNITIISKDSSTLRPPRLQEERAEPRSVFKYPFRSLPSKAARVWMEERMTFPVKWEERLSTERPKTLVICCPVRGMGKTALGQSFNTHIYMRDVLDPALLYDCMHDQEAHYILIDDVPWSKLMDKRSMGPAIIGGQRKCTWKDGRHVYRIPLGLPVIVLCNKLPSVQQQQEWEGRLLYVNIKPGRSMFSKLPVQNIPPILPLLPSPAAESAPAPAVKPSSSLPSQVELSPAPTVESASSSALPVIESSSSSTVDTSLPPPAECPSQHSSVHSIPVAHPYLEKSLLDMLVFRISKAHTTLYGPDSCLITQWIPEDDGRRLMRELDAQRSDYKQMYYRGKPLKRLKAYYCNRLDGAVKLYTYTASVLESFEDHEFNGPTLELRDAVRGTIYENVNSLVSNLYLDGDKKISYHFDKPEDLEHGSAIANVSLGGTRVMRLCERPAFDDWNAEVKARAARVKDGLEPGPVPKLKEEFLIDIPLPHCSLFVLGPETNATYVHSILESKEPVDPRYGLTYRTVASHWLPDELISVRQPPPGQQEWMVTYHPLQPHADGRTHGQNGPYHAKILQPGYVPVNPTRLQPEDIAAVRDRGVVSTNKRRRNEDEERQVEDDKQDEDSTEEEQEDDEEEEGSTSNNKKQRCAEV